MRERVAGWKRIFDTEDNAISKALSRLAWDVCAYSCVVEMVRQAPVVSEEKRLNGMVMDLLAQVSGRAQCKALAGWWRKSPSVVHVVCARWEG
jgi:hypothetical protein